MTEKNRLVQEIMKKLVDYGLEPVKVALKEYWDLFPNGDHVYIDPDGSIYNGAVPDENALAMLDESNLRTILAEDLPQGLSLDEVHAYWESKKLLDVKPSLIEDGQILKLGFCRYLYVLDGRFYIGHSPYTTDASRNMTPIAFNADVIAALSRFPELQRIIMRAYLIELSGLDSTLYSLLKSNSSILDEFLANCINNHSWLRLSDGAVLSDVTKSICNSEMEYKDYSVWVISRQNDLSIRICGLLNFSKSQVQLVGSSGHKGEEYSMIFPEFSGDFANELLKAGCSKKQYYLCMHYAISINLLNKLDVQICPATFVCEQDEGFSEVELSIRFVADSPYELLEYINSKVGSVMGYSDGDHYGKKLERWLTR